MKARGVIGTAALVLLLGATAPAGAEQGKHGGGQGKSDKQDKGKGQARAGKEQQKGQGREAAPQARHEQQQQAKPRQQQQPIQQQANLQQRQVRVQQEQRPANPQHAQRQVRLSQGRQRQLISQQQQRVVVYRQYLNQQEPRSLQYGVRLQQQNRTATYRFHQQYFARVRLQQTSFQRSYDYDNDPYFYTASSYRYSRGGSDYETNEYGANVLREAINNGYAEGYSAGQADREDRWSSDYRGSFAYQDANYGYDGYYASQDDYNYYFREGFQRGYEDGYNRRAQYGHYSNGSRSVLGAILSEILNLQSVSVTVR